jgi:hypothetical protein
MSSRGAAVGFPGAKADSTGVSVILGASLVAEGAVVGVENGSNDGASVGVAPGVGDEWIDGTTAVVGVTVEVVTQAFKISRTDKIKEGAIWNFRMNTSDGRSGYSAEFWLNIALTP